MRKFKVLFMKPVKIMGLQQPIMTFAEQLYHSDTDTFKINVLQDFQLVSITELLPDKIIKHETKATN